MTNKIIISDTSCLLALDKIGLLLILSKLFPVIITTIVVEKEYGKPLPDWITIQSVQNTGTQKELQEYLDAGEASAIALALETDNCVLIIDEKTGRKVASRLHLEIAGTLQVLLFAKTKGLIKSLSEVITQLEQTNFYISEKLKEEVIKKANE